MYPFLPFCHSAILFAVWPFPLKVLKTSTNSISQNSDKSQTRSDGKTPRISPRHSSIYTIKDLNVVVVGVVVGVGVYHK
jgi:hypothetical protein